ncbi:FAD/NAD(P)-binding domain-containing protein [Hypoxylon trugodes]|uniref:FAD/NAD(P)-binding domain-containing protein n=1 Tax=Hypoxylon trugodes TaxID=326681 RepID=UPI0021949DB5|nr:FAD/NAD(P)-binding domain-containing protein [Hypoxylon trugodes]KAI1391045.1 FAD/NAD(P)-binding domain-containing protein [Hypoxylon trugodes]
MTKTIVILGAGLAGLPLAHYLISRTASQVSDLRVVLVSPQTHFYWNVASVRLVLPNQPQLPEEKYLFPIAEQFTQYPHKDRFEFVLGSATKLTPEQNSVTVTVSDGSNKDIEISYHTLVIATGTTYKTGMPWKTLPSTESTRTVIANLQSSIEAASSIVVAGAGVTGVEFAGELGSAFSKHGKKKVTVLHSEALPLESRLQERVRTTAKKELQKLGVEYVGNARVTAVTPAAGGKGEEVKVEIKESGKTTTTTITADLVIPTYGAEYNTSFVPASMHDPSSPGRLLVTPDLRSPSHSNIFIVGDVSTLQAPQAVHSEAQIRHLMKQLSPSYFASASPSAVTLEPYYKKPDELKKIMLGLTIGKDRGAGQVGTFQPPSILIWWLKGRHIGTDYSHLFAAGARGANGAWPN